MEAIDEHDIGHLTIVFDKTTGRLSISSSYLSDKDCYLICNKIANSMATKAMDRLSEVVPNEPNTNEGQSEANTELVGSNRKPGSS